jgi:hypothetical protein
MRPSPTRGLAPCLGLLLVIGAIRPVVALGAADAHDQWVRAVELNNAGPELTPGKMHQKMELLDGKGATTSVTEIWAELTRNDHGELRSETIKATRDGKDVSKKARDHERKAASRPSKKGDRDVSVSSDGDPFSKNQSGVRTTRRGRDVVASRQCATYDYVQEGTSTDNGKQRPTVFRGRAWLDLASGQPMRVEYVQDPLPSMTKEMKTTIIYETLAGGHPVASEIRIEGAAGFLFIKKRFRLTIQLSEYAPTPAQDRSR